MPGLAKSRSSRGSPWGRWGKPSSAKRKTNALSTRSASKTSSSSSRYVAWPASSRMYAPFKRIGAPVSLSYSAIPMPRASVARTAVGAGAELSDRDRLPLRDEGADARGVAVGDLSRPVQIHAHEVEGCPVDALERDGGVGDPAAEAFADARHGIPEEVVDTPTELADPLAPSIRFSVQQQRDPVRRGRSAQEPRVHQAQLGADNEHDLGAPLADPLRPLGAVGEQREHRVGRQLERVRREPDLQAEVGGGGRRQLQPRRITAGDADGVAVQVVADDAQLALHDVRIESLTRDRSITDEAGVIRDALGAHGSAPR